MAIQVEAHRSDVATLLRTEQIARTANLQVAHGDLETATQRTVLLNGTHPFAGLGQQLGVAWQHQVAIGLVLVATHTAAELVQFAQTKTIRPIDDYRVGIGNV